MSPRFSSPINQASPNEPIPISPTTENTNQGEDGYKEIKQTAEDVVNEFAELFETGETFVDTIQSDVSEDVVQNYESEDEDAPGRYESTHSFDNEDEDYTPKEDDEHADDLVNEATDLEEEADGVINSLGNFTNNLYQEQYHSVEDEDVKQELVLKLETGMQWKSMEECRKFLKTLAIQNLFSFRQKQNDKKRYIIYCIGEDHSDQEMVKGCTLKVACSLTTDNHTVKLKKYVGTHTCEADGNNHVVQAKAPWVATVLEDFLRDHPNMKPVDVHNEVFKRYGVELSYYTSWKSKVIMFEKINGNYESSYAAVSELKNQILKRNQGSVVNWYCFRHMYKNFKVDFKGELLRDLSWRAPEAFKECHHDIYMEKIEAVDEEAKEWLEREAKSTWARSHFDLTTKYDVITNNFSESFNSWILNIRDKPLVQFIDQYNLDVMKLIHERRIISQELVHGIVVHSTMSSPFKATYVGYIYPFDNEEEWDKVKVGNEVLPPPFERKSRRPRKIRIRDADEDKPSNNRCYEVNVQSQPNVDHIPRARRRGRGRRGGRGSRGRGGRGSRGRGGRGMTYWFGEDTPPRSSQATPPPRASSTQ
ncbi:hypothetical protein IFM89_024805 [Coptis chinensis]|uniref:Transposase MuDR plant domain-containing protein n=1 Tax=Coptis chinensis TaxID=261450 RepID=A0A835LNE1_9MAGN|nr:hypothetical protein IFM89_024805 [Coptis chinensis]